MPEIKCPTCGKEDFDTEGGMKCHHTFKHGESIAKIDVECEWCGKIEPVYESKVSDNDHDFCCEEHYGKWKSENTVGEDAPAWLGGKNRRPLLYLW